MKRKVVPLLLAMAMVLSMLTSCGSGGTSSTTSDSGTDSAQVQDSEQAQDSEQVQTDEGTSGKKEMTIGIPGTPEVLSPFAPASTGSLYLTPVIYESLGYFTDSSYSEFKNQLMESWELADDNMTYTVHLHEDIYDTAGNHLTADDVVFSFDKGIEGGSLMWGSYVEEYHAEDEYTVVIKLNAERANTFTDICRSAVVTQAAYEASPDNMNTTPVSTAQYVLTDMEQGSVYVLERNEDYWNKDESTWLWKSNADKVTYQVILEESQMAIALETGAIDVAVGMSNDNTQKYADDENYNMYQLIGNMAYTLMFNNSEGNIFHNNQNLRQAVAYAVDVDGIIEGVLGGAGVKLGTFGFCLAADYREEWADSYYSYNLEKAQELIAESGVDTSDLNIVLACGSGTVLEKTAEMVQLYLLAAGFNTVEIKIADTALFSTLKVDDTEWDILLDTKGLQTVADGASTFDRTLFNYGNAIFLMDDDVFQEMVVPLVTISGNTQDKVDEYVEYLNDMCYVYALYNTATYTVSTNNITYILQDFRSAVIPGMTEFAE